MRARRRHAVDRIAHRRPFAVAQRGTATDTVPHTEITNYYEHAMRVLGAYIDSQKAHDVFLFEQEGSFVLRLFGVSGSRASHQLAEFTRDEILAMIASAPEQRQQPAPNPTGAP